MGIWPKGSDGTDVNALDVNLAKGIVATGKKFSELNGQLYTYVRNWDLIIHVLFVADDFGKLALFNYPCVVDNAPRSLHGGHSSHVMNVKFSSNDSNDVKIITVGGNDNAAITWKVV